MALKMNYTKFGTTFTDAYFRVSVIQTTKDQGYTVVAQVYVSGVAAGAGSEPLANLSYQIPYMESLDSNNDGSPDLFTNPLSFAYALLKTLPEYASAVEA